MGKTPHSQISAHQNSTRMQKVQGECVLIPSLPGNASNREAKRRKRIYNSRAELYISCICVTRTFKFCDKTVSP